MFLNISILESSLLKHATIYGGVASLAGGTVQHVRTLIADKIIFERNLQNEFCFANFYSKVSLIFTINLILGAMNNIFHTLESMPFC